jgi:Coenzyme Q (ubiquinone) biosynthesis protein Coq4
MAGSKQFPKNSRYQRPALRAVQNINPFSGIDWREFGLAYRVFIANPGQGILHILAAAQNSTWQKWVIRRLSRQAAALYMSDLSIDMPALLQLPADTLGGAYARHMTQQGFDPEAFVRSNHDDRLTHRLALSHDIYHVITGFDGSPVGEFGVAAFTLVQYRDLLNVFVLSFVPWSMLGFPLQAGRMLMAIGQGFRLGCRCRPIVAYPFEANWPKPLREVRHELGI